MTDKLVEGNTIGSDIENKYHSSYSLVNQTIKKLGDVLSANSGVFCYLVLFIIGVLIFLYKITN